MTLIASLTTTSAFAAASPKGVLRASFEAYWTGGGGASYGTWAHGGKAWFHAANTGVDLAARASRLGLYDSEHCASNLIGIWAFIGWTPKDGLLSATWEMSFGPLDGPLTSLAIQRTAAKHPVDPQGFWYAGDDFWAQSIGIPVYNKLEPGRYTMHAVTSLVGFTDEDGNIVQEWNPVYTILDC
jgi:hypothetical protein